MLTSGREENVINKFIKRDVMEKEDGETRIDYKVLFEEI